MTALTDLLARVEKADGPDAWLFRDVLLALVPDPLTGGEAATVPVQVFRANALKLFRAGGYLDATLALVERVLGADWRWLLTNVGYDGGVYQGGCGATIHSPISSGGGPKWSGFANTPALALLAALLRALIAQETQRG